MASTAQYEASLRPQVTPTRLRLMTYADLADIPPAAWVIDQTFCLDALTVVFGPSGVGKSFLALDMALAVATGTDWQGHSVTQGHAVYIAAEGVRGIRKRVAAWLM